MADWQKTRPDPVFGAPAAVVQQEQARLSDFVSMLTKLEAQHARLG